MNLEDKMTAGSLWMQEQTMEGVIRDVRVLDDKVNLLSARVDELNRIVSGLIRANEKMKRRGYERL